VLYSGIVLFQFSSVTRLCPTVCDPMGCSTPSFLVHHQLPELAQTHVCLVSDAIQPISSSVVPFSSCPQSFPASGSFPMSQVCISGGQSIRVSASASVLPMNIQDWFPLGWTGLISCCYTINTDGVNECMFPTVPSSALRWPHRATPSPNAAPSYPRPPPWHQPLLLEVTCISLNQPLLPSSTGAMGLTLGACLTPSHEGLAQHCVFSTFSLVHLTFY